MKQPRGFYRGVFALMIPMVLQNLITQTLTFADVFMVGLLGQNYLAAVSTVATPFFVVMVLMMGVQSGAGVLIAQYWGKGNAAVINRILGVGLYISFAVSVIGAILMSAFPHTLLNMIINDQNIVQLGLDYARIIGFSYVFNSISGMYIAAQRSMGNPKIGFFVLTISAVFNVFANWVLIFGHFGFPALGIKGAAIATLFSRVLEVIIVACYAFKNKRFILNIKLLLKPGLIIVKDFFKYSLPVILNEALWGIGAMLYPIILGHMSQSAVILAAYTIAGNIERIFGITVFATGGATAIIIGREIGAGRKDTVYSVGKTMIVLSMMLGFASGALLMFARFTFLDKWIYPLFKLDQAAQATSTTMITILAVVMLLRSLGVTLGIGVLRGGGDVRAVMFIDVGTLYFLAIPAAALSALVFGAPIAVVYSCIALEDIGKAILLLRRFRGKRWINDVTRAELPA
ncbi:MAG: MATE family efflux transporter [Clostridiales bacterium]|nr:MATE family efflux transporter [Clostridiales bacterium]